MKPCIKCGERFKGQHIYCNPCLSMEATIKAKLKKLKKETIKPAKTLRA